MGFGEQGYAPLCSLKNRKK